jgi:diacylglycerol kinase (ATP)
MPEFIQSRMRAFRYAFSGWWYVIRTQRTEWIHARVSILVVLVCALLGITAVEWALIILAVALVWTAEFLNTALEAVVDLASPAENHLAKVGKDVGAAGVLIASFCAAVIGLLIIGPPLWERLIFYLNK